MERAMDPDAARAAADLLWRHWQEGRPLSALPAPLRPATRRDGYAVQAHVAARSAAPLFGWKIAATSLAGQEHIGAAGPMAGRLLAERVVAPGGEIPLAGNRMRVAEAEIAFRMARDLPARDAPYTVAEVTAAVAGAHLAIEFPNSRLADYAAAGEAALIADNACAHLFVLGPALAPGWRDRDLAALPTAIAAPGRPPHRGRGGNALDDPRIALAWLANEVAGLGPGLRAGEVVTTGTTTVPLPIEAGDVVTAEFDGLGTLSARVGA
ncbi:2-keto-4-pentenoate hydratase [Methylobacterium crusticola]|uniref:2-keto-4-pentenoate hydratase n=1 Tax=Methylobacterium crusticola TaxID=1697972 RepID=A0ABQ4QRB3_9HYPH|nr:fumarylacetoacetate hydrolase family protein [Methylobacterium crusticola]GJD47732.1 2-keto-4-pentenoate hydratase [Methylobacterium crusticola]